MKVFKTAQTNAEIWQAIDKVNIANMGVLLKQAYPTYTLKDFADPLTTPISPTNGDCYLVDQAGTVWGLTVVSNNIIARVAESWTILTEKINELGTKISEVNAGKSVYEIAVQFGFEGTEAEYNAYVNTAKTAAETAASTAITAKNDAVTAQAAAITAQTAAETASANSQTAATEAISAASNSAKYTLSVGKNKFNINADDISLNHYISWFYGTLLESGSYNTTGFIPVVAGMVYTLSYKHEICWFNSAKVRIAGSASTDTSKQQTAPTGAAYLRCTVHVANWATFQVEIGTAQTSWEAYAITKVLENMTLPSHSQAIASITGLQSVLDSKPNLVAVVGKNKFNINDSDIAIGYYVNQTNGNLTANASYNATGDIPVVAGTTYYLSYKHNIVWKDSNKNWIAGSESTDTSKQQTAPTGAAYLRCTVHVANWATFQVEIGTAQTSWEAYDSHYEPENTKIAAANIVGLTAAITPAMGFTKTNRISMPSKQYFLENYENTIYHAAILERNIPSLFNVQLENGTFQNRRLHSRITNPVADSSVDANLYDIDFNVISAKNFALVVGAQATDNGTLVINAIGDSFTYNSSYLKKTRLLCPSLTFTGMRIPYGDTTIKVEGRGGWKLSDYCADKIHATNTSFSPFLHLPDPYKYFGNTDFWKKVVNGDTTYEYNNFAATASAIGFSASTGLKTTPTVNDVMYNDTNARYEKWDGSAWVASGHSNSDFSINYGKYRNVWGITQPNIVTILLGLNDFMALSIAAVTAAFSTWKTQMESLITSIHADSPNAKIAILTPCSAVAGGNDFIDYNYPVAKYNASMWNARKLIIDNFDNRDSEKIYIVDAGSAVDPVFGFLFNTAEKPFSDYSGTETIKLQNNNPHPSTEGYYQLGVRLAAFIQSIR